ncbi:MAG TPA: penicillin-binding transpeptidase domain-containing protein [Trebonia sp.]
MIDELDRLAELRPQVGPPADDVRHAARARLDDAIDDPARSPARGRQRRRVPAGGLVSLAAAVIATVVVAGGAIVMLRGSRAPHPAARGLAHGSTAVRGEIRDDAGAMLAGERLQSDAGVRGRRLRVRTYPLGELAAQALGTVGPVDAAELRRQPAHGGSLGAVIGQAGLEAAYDPYLGAGDTLRLSLDARLQAAGQRALRTSMAANHAPGGAFVAMNPDNGAVYAMGSLPSYDPSVFTGNLTQAKYDQLINPTSGDPLLDRAIQSAGPIGSTFKPITATAALQSGQWSIDSMFDDTGQYCVGTGGAQQCRHNSGHAVDGSLNLVNALRVSSDDFFYNLGALTNSADPATHPNGGPLDQWAGAFGIGRPTGIDLPAEVSGTLPTPVWRAHRNRLEAECESATGPFRYTNGQTVSARRLKGYRRSPQRAPGGCGIADGTNRPWSIGDNESLAVGQGDLQVTPLQLAVAYAGLANGGTIVRPHLGEAIESPTGAVLRRIDPAPLRHLAIDPLYLETIRQGLREAASQPGGTSADVMGNFREQVYGETGTAQYTNQPDYAWYACFVPATATSKPIVVVVHVEKGGFGDVAAAPVARQILSQWFFGKAGKYVAGTSTTL